MRRLSCLVAVSLAVSLSGSCATERVEWGDETPVEREVIVKEASSSSTMTAADYAKKFPTDSACESEARRIYDKSPDLAVRLIKACIARGDFRRMTGISDAPWARMLARDSDAVELCGRVVAARAGDVEADVKSCAQIGIPVVILADLFESPDKAKGRRVIFRGRTDAEIKGKDRIRLVETGIEQGELDTQPTGRRVAASFSGGVRTPAGDGIFVGRGVSVVDDAIANDGEFVANVSVDLVLTPAQRPTFDR